jgi:hypothetical protein
MVDRGIPPTRAELRNLRAARDALQSVVRGDTAPVDLQRFVAAVSLRPAADGDGLTWNLGTAKGSTGATRAVLAWDALRIGSPGRLRPCENQTVANTSSIAVNLTMGAGAQWPSVAIG